MWFTDGYGLLIDANILYFQIELRAVYVITPVSYLRSITLRDQI